MTINGKPKTPIIAAQSKKKDSGEEAQASRTATKKNNGVKSAVLERISDGVLALDAGLNYEYLNERAGELLGCTPGDLIGKSLWQAHPGVEQTPLGEACRRALETQSVVLLDGYFPASDRWLEGRVYPSTDGLSVLFSEDTRQKQEENRRREERYRILFDTMQEGFLLAEVVENQDGTRDARLLEVNASMSRFLARSRDELVGKTVREVFPLDEEDHRVLEHACRVALGESEPFFLERYEAAAGGWLRAHLFSPRAGQFASLVTDITEQKEAAARLQDVSKLPGQNPNPVMRFTPAGEILYINQASRSLLSAWESHEPHTTPLEQVRELLPSVLEGRSNREIEVANDRTFYMGLLVPVQEEGYINLYLRDITERKQAEETLHAYIHQTNAGITRTDLEGRLTFVNQAFCDMLGYPESELVGKTIWEISHPDDIARNRTMFESLVREGESYQLEKRVLRRNGSFLWINVGTSPLRDATGRIQAATSIVVDITRRKRAEEALLESARRTLYLSSLSDALHSLSDPSRIRIEAARLLGASLKASRVAYVEIEPDGTAYVRDNYVDNLPDIIGQFPIYTCIPADQMSRFRAGRTVTASDIPNDTRFDEAQKSTHEMLTVQAQIVVPFLHNDELIAALCIQQDEPRLWRNEEISLVEETAERLQAEIERAHAERKLRESERRFQQAASAARALVYEVDVISGASVVVHGMDRLAGYAPEETQMSSEWWHSLIHPEDLPAHLAQLEKLLAAGGTDVSEYRLQHSSGTWITVQDNRMLVQDETGKNKHLIGTVIDISERKQTEEALRSSEERLRLAIEANRMVAWEWDPAVDRVSTSGNLLDVYGLTEVSKEAEGFALILPEDLPAHREKVNRVKQQGGEYISEFRITRPADGRIVWMEERAAALADVEGRITHLAGVVTDVTERKRAEHEQAEFARQQQALFQLADRLNRTGTLEDVYDPALDAILNALQCDRASILLYDEENVMRFVAWRGLSDAYRQATDGHSPWTPDVVDPQPIPMGDTRTAELDDELRSVIRREGIDALAFIPLVSNEKLIGKFMVYFNEPHVLDEGELEFALTIAHQLASTIERKRAEETMAADLANMQILRDLGARLVTEGDLQRIYQEFVRAAVSITHADAGTVQILDEDSQELILLASHGLDQDMIEHFRRVKSGSGTSCGIALASRERAFVGYDDPAVEDPDGSRRKHVEAGLLSAQSTPLISRSGTPIGMISTHWSSHHRSTEQELRYIDLLARQATDLIERRLGEEALGASEQRFARFMQHLPGLAWLKDTEGRYVYANAAAEKAFGASGENLYGKTDEDIFPAEFAAQFKRNDERALLDEKGIQVVETLEHEDKVLHYSLVSKFPVPGPDGSPALIGGTAFDITERIHMEDALQTAREHAERTASRMERIQKVTASLSKALTPQKVLQVIVDQGAPSLGATTSTVLLLTDDGQNLEIVYSNQHKPLIESYQSFPLSLQVPAADAVRSGQPVWIESRQQYLERYPHLAEQIELWGLEAALAIPMLHKGRTLGVLTLSFDHVLPHSREDQEYILTLAGQGAQSLGRARAEEALRDSEERYRAIISQATAGIVRKDTSGRLLFVNQAFCNMLGMTDTELIGRTLWELTHEDDQEENKRLYNRLMEEGTPFQLEKRLIRADGSTLWVNVSVSPVMGESGKPQSAVSVYADITRRKQAENRLMLLARVSELTRQVEEPEELLYAVAREAGDYFQVRRALFNEIDVGKDREVIHRDYCRDAESVAGVHKISDYSRVTSFEMMAGKTVVNKDSKIDPRTAGEYERSYVPYGERAYVAVPLMHEDRWVASLWISDDRPRQWDKDDVYLLEAIAERTWTAAEKMRVDRALRDSEERLRVTFNTTAVGFALLTPDTRFVDVNDALCQIVGYTREELLALTLDKLIRPDFIVSTQDHISRLLDGEVSAFTIEKLYIRGDGAEIWVQNSISLVRDLDENPLHLIAICQDITERKREEETLRARTEEIETLMNVSPIGIFVANDPECRFISANPAGYRLLEVPDSSQMNISKSAPPQEQPGYRVFRDGVEVAAEDMPMQAAARYGIELKEDALELRFESGARKYVYAFAKPLFNAKGQSRGAIAAMLDISERKRAEEQLHQLNLQLEERVSNRTAELQAAYEFLRESEATSRLILESMPDAIVITDREGKIVHANTQVETLFGYTPNEVLGKAVEMLLPERFSNRHSKNRDTYATQRTRRIMGLGYDLFGRRKDASEFPVNVILSPISNNTSWDVMVSIRDNTKQREAQEALRINEEKLRTLFEILPVGISFLGKEGRIVDMNPALTEILGLSKEDLLKGSFKARRYIRSDGLPMPQKELASRRAIAEKKTVYNVETGIVQENGEIKWTSVNAAPVQVADVEAVVVTIDITDRKQSEEAINRHRESLKLLSRRLVEVQEDERRAIARELHDRVGQNLAALTLNLNILRSQLNKEILEKVGTRLNDSVTLVKDVLAITRSVMADLRPNVLDDYGLDAALNEYADRFSQRFGIRVVNNMPSTPTPRLDPGVEMTLLRIAQEALTNIARHAQASQASMKLAIEHDAAHLVIEDNGIGILSWQKVNQPGSHGIRIMRERAEAFGGGLKVHSAYKNGTKIEVRIPFGGGATRDKTTQEKRS